MSSTTIARGNILEQFIIAPSLTPTALTTASVQSLQTFPIPGLLTTDIVTFITVIKEIKLLILQSQIVMLQMLTC